MNHGKVVKNAGSHRILHALSLGDCTSKELKNVVGAINSVARFEGEYMKRLLDNGLVRRKGDRWEMTMMGQAKLKDLGSPDGVPTGPTVATRRYTNMDTTKQWTGSNSTVVYRPGSEDFLKYPSRVGDTLIYRDGRKVKANDRQHGRNAGALSPAWGAVCGGQVHTRVPRRVQEDLPRAAHATSGEGWVFVSRRPGA